ncbi:hypothetical protein AMATHDRAFT_56653 [Amanita thiersii Skay4041]|uniref:Tafazzin family protein n=1 Tax=Amanita thiersii Skay4041 TaxID=703135 RepID=A0A2A9NWB0_9AGAR|nr:hypothetical protein AMATHDRAFT_56653 [Amanita thiersii Skay4041]
MTRTSLLSTATVVTVGLLSKTFLRCATASVTVNGLQALLDVLHNPERSKGRGIITVSNHISTLDDPVTWGVLPTKCYFNTKTTRWTLGASDIMFTNALFSRFFRLGQTIETFRGRGIYQPAVDTAINKLNQGAWVHLYGEGKVCQPNTYWQDHEGRATLPRFKWGIGRMLMEAQSTPVVIPVWLAGFEQLMPEGRPFPYKYIPRLGIRLSVTFGDPLPAEDVRNALGRIYRVPGDCSSSRQDEKLSKDSQGCINVLRSTNVRTMAELDRVRSEVTDFVRLAVLDLGRKVSGPMLSGSARPPE